MWYVWLALAIILSILEIFTPGFFLLCTGIACLAGMAASFFGISLYLQLLVFALALILVMVLLRPVLKRINKDKKTNADRMIGRTAKLTKASSADEKGSLRLDGVDWPVTSESPIREGSKVEITAIEGITLRVKEVK